METIRKNTESRYVEGFFFGGGGGGGRQPEATQQDFAIYRGGVLKRFLNRAGP